MLIKKDSGPWSQSVKNQCGRDIKNFKDIFEGIKTTPSIMTVLKSLTFFTARQEKTLTHLICKVRTNTLYFQNKIHYIKKGRKVSKALHLYRRKAFFMTKIKEKW